MPRSLRILILVLMSLSLIGGGFALGALGQVLSALPDLAGGGHATGGHHSVAPLVIGTGGGVVAAVVSGILFWRLTEPKKPPGRH